MFWSDITMGVAIFGLVVSACSPSISAWIQYRSKLKIAKFAHFSKCRSEAASRLLSKFGEFRLQPALYAYSLYANPDELAFVRAIAEKIDSGEHCEAIKSFDELQRCMTARTERLYRLDPRHKKPR